MRRTQDAGGAAEQVAAALREEILGGHLPGGAPVREQEVAARLGVSRTPVREAVGRLVAEGLLIKDGNRTAHVFRPSLAELLEIYEIRTPLESLAARLACTAADEAFLDRLEAAGRALTEALPGVDWSAKHEAFHLCLVAGSGRPRLEALVRTLRAQSEPYVRFAVAFDADLGDQARRDHENIVALARARAADDMEALVRSHLAATSNRVSALLESHQVPSPTPRSGGVP
ncbi:GntR family transcriptional regulator [Pseudonocardia sp. KRD-184]|uniref:GntR family transcriptional regulator n=1 Tax=Pseudonocardia oceani TaxID=2792013 RepID=A0ABS6UEG3_9PSEU|nr:GntR family transcriptional regulator [Pseudonocardia oceani]MBW0088049.1 GntR family transcriptional regulator [Pseudonocardia oceani]MBW0094456.1 GntR family transcriptional regulator [Pseudonocardia oceani]MBW0107520.1 GntR family transcriptional regulator [Pseudonocardia oceani]MBW0120417.1 GntR family transcriptional regulator [Pseudonocardia oceani]MBW0130625.1 GntR family transcriptional regulator [Pseudonocardia oceani]